MRLLPHLAALVLVACSSAPQPTSTSTPTQRASAEPALRALREARFEEAGREAEKVLAADHESSVAAAVRAFSRYHHAIDLLRGTFENLEKDFDGEREIFDDTRLRAALRDAEAALAEVDRDLAIAAADPDFSLELCLACWRRDWNHSGEVDDRDLLLFQVEMNADGSEIPEGDPRRKPTFRFDIGDVHWARSMVAFQRAAMNIVAAYRWGEVAKLGGFLFGHPPLVRFPLADAGLVRRARDLVLEGLGHADRTREAYLAERDDDREWVPGPAQKNHPLPLPVDRALYDTWGGVVGDLRRLVRGEEGLDLAEIMRLAEPKWQRVPGGYLDIGRMFSEPRDIVIDFPALDKLDNSPDGMEATLRSVFGAYYVERMKPSPLVGRLARMRAEIDRGDDSLERKLRYLIWLN